MSLIIGYSHRNKQSAVGALYADDRVGYTNDANWSTKKGDKISQLSDRFFVGILGLQVTQWAINYAVADLNQYDLPDYNFDSVDNLSRHLEDSFRYIISRWRTNDNIYVPEQENSVSALILLDVQDKRIYYSDVIRVWKLEELKIKFNLTADGMHAFFLLDDEIITDFLNAFGHIKPLKSFKKELFLEKINKITKNFNNEFRDKFSDSGSYKISVSGKGKYSFYKSSFGSYKEYFDIYFPNQEEDPIIKNL